MGQLVAEGFPFADLLGDREARPEALEETDQQVGDLDEVVRCPGEQLDELAVLRKEAHEPRAYALGGCASAPQRYP